MMLSSDFLCIVWILVFTTKPEPVIGDSETEEAKCTRMTGVADRKTTMLRKTLLCNSSMLEPPGNTSDGNRVEVNLYFTRHHVRDLPDSEWFELSGYIAMVWADPRLKWDMEVYQNISRLRVTSDEVWIPEVYLNSAGRDVFAREAIVDSSGEVVSPKWTSFLSTCKPIYHSWGDRRACTISMTMRPDEAYIALLDGMSLSPFPISKGSKWGIVSIDRIYPRDAKEAGSSGTEQKAPIGQPGKYGPGYIEARVTLQRNFAIKDAAVFAPAAVSPISFIYDLNLANRAIDLFAEFVLAILLVVSTWLSATSASRVAMLSAIFVIQVLMFHQACHAMPYMPDRLVDIVALYRDLILCSGAAILEWLLAYSIASQRATVSAGLKTAYGRSSNSWLFAFVSTIFAIPVDRTKDGNQVLQGVFSALLDRVTFVALSIVLFFLFVVLAERPPEEYMPDYFSM